MKKMSKSDFIKIAIDKMLETYKVSYDWVVANQEVDGRPWFQHFTWTQKESDEYRDWFINYLQKEVKPKFSKSGSINEWIWFNLMWGLKIKDDDKKI